MKLLYVEDSAALGRAMKKALAGLGHVVTLAHTCAEARQAGAPYDVGIFDLTLPDGDGIALCRELLGAGHVRAALFCSGSVDDAWVERARRVAPVISKQASLREVEAAILAAAGRP